MNQDGIMIAASVRKDMTQKQESHPENFANKDPSISTSTVIEAEDHGDHQKEHQGNTEHISIDTTDVKWSDVIESANMSGAQAFDLLSTYTNLITLGSQSYEGISPRTNVEEGDAKNNSNSNSNVSNHTNNNNNINKNNNSSNENNTNSTSNSTSNSKTSTPAGNTSISQQGSLNPSAVDLFGADFGALSTSTDLDILQGGFANTANPPAGIEPYTNANSSSVSLAHVPSMSKSSSRSTALPGDEYTPLISPAVTPVERVSSVGKARKVGFSPLTSPALEFQQYHSKSASLRQKRKEHQDDRTGDLSRRGSASSFKRSKTPSTTPLMGPMNGRIPSAAYAYGKSTSKYLYRHPLGSKHVQQQHQQQQHQRRRSSQNSLKSQDGAFDVLSDELMLPPSSQQNEQGSGDQAGRRSTHNSQTETSKGPAFATPATLMSFPLSGPHHARNSPRLMTNDNVFANPKHNATSAQSSPVILPSSSSAILLQQQQQQQKHLQQKQRQRQKFLVQGSREMSGEQSSPTVNVKDDTDGSPTWPSTRRGSASSGKSNSSKKMNHKLAEQGRRNRMNVAIQELDNIIPDTYKDGSLVPSKATTVEMSSKYIRDLQAENRQIRKELEQAKAQLEKYVNGRGASTVESGSSISPLEYLDGDSNKKTKDQEDSV